MANKQYDDLREQVWRANMEIPARGLAIYTWGNVSGLDAKAGVFAIKPSGVAYDKLKPQDIVIVDIDGKVVDGAMRPSSDTPTHALLYRSFSGIGGIVHTHSTYACAWAQAARSVPLYGTTHADHLTTDIPCTDFMGDQAIKNDYEVETGKQIVATFAKAGLDHHEVPMVLVAGHGPFAWGDNPEKAVYNAAVLEEVARMAMLTEQINPKAARLSPAIIQKHYDRKHGPKSYYGQK